MEFEGDRLDLLVCARLAVVRRVGAADRLLDLIDEVACRVQRIPIHAVVDPVPVSTGRDQASTAKHAKMFRDSRLAVGHDLLERAHAERPSGCDVREKLKTNRVSESPEDLKRHIPRFGDEPRLSERKRMEAMCERLGHRARSLARVRIAQP